MILGDYRMKLNLTCCLFVLESKKAEDIRKSDVLNLKVLVRKDTNSLFSICYNGEDDMKDVLRREFKTLVGFSDMSFEQVYTIANKEYLIDGCDVIYVGITNMENIKHVDSNYELKDISIKDNSIITLGDEKIKYKTIQRRIGSGNEYIHKINVDDVRYRKMLLEIIITMKYIRSRLDTTDILFKFMPKLFALEDVRTLYELLKDTSVDKSNFRKKIMKYCSRSENVIDNRGYRPTYLFTYKPLENDAWI